MERPRARSHTVRAVGPVFPPEQITARYVDRPAKDARPVGNGGLFGGAVLETDGIDRAG